MEFYKTTDRQTDAFLSCLIESVAGATAHDTTTAERTNRVLARLTLDARVLIQCTLIYVYVTHIHTLS